MLKATVKEVDRPGRSILQVISRKGKPIQEFRKCKGVRSEVVAYFKENNLKPTSGSPAWLLTGVNYG